MKILIIDDEFVSRVKLQKILLSYGSCHLACNGEEAMQAFVSAHEDGAPYDLATVDINLPDIKGQELVDQFRQYEKANKLFHKEIKVLMVSIMTDSKNIMSSFKKGCEGYLSKPFNPEQVRASILGLGLG